MVEEECEEDGCPSLITLAKTPFEKAAAEEFVKVDRKLDSVKKDLSWLKWIVTGVLTVSAISLAILAVKTALGV